MFVFDTEKLKDVIIASNGSQTNRSHLKSCLLLGCMYLFQGYHYFRLEIKGWQVAISVEKQALRLV